MKTKFNAIILVFLFLAMPMAEIVARDIMSQEVNYVAQNTNLKTNAQYIESRTFKTDDKGHSITVGVTKEKDKNGKSSIHVLNNLTPQEKEEEYNYFIRTGEVLYDYIDENISHYNKVTWNIFDDTGKKVRKISFDQFAGARKSFVTPAVTKYIKTLMSKYDTNVPNPKNVSNNLSLSARNGFSSYNFDKSRLEAAKNTEQFFGIFIIGKGKVETLNGIYNLLCYSHDDNLKNYESVSIEKEDGLKLKVKNIFLQIPHIEGSDGAIKCEPLKVVETFAYGAGTVLIEDGLLFDFLNDASDAPQFNNAYDGDVIEYYEHMNTAGNLITADMFLPDF